jgi:hypothetical protein
MRTPGAVIVCVALGGFVGLAQTPPAGRSSGQPGQARGQVTDPKRVIFEMQDSLGMLRGLQQQDSIRRLEYWGTTGAVAVQGRLVPMEKFRVSINYAVPGLRLDLAYGGKREIRVVADGYAWNEDTPGGRATPMPGAAGERLLDLWLTPIGLAKAAAASADTRVTIENGATVLTFPAAGTTAKVTLNAMFLPERVQAQAGASAIDVSYSDYADLNDVAKADVFLPRRTVQKRDGAAVLELTAETSNTNNPYVIMPVPDNVKASSGARP